MKKKTQIYGFGLLAASFILALTLTGCPGGNGNGEETSTLTGINVTPAAAAGAPMSVVAGGAGRVLTAAPQPADASLGTIEWEFVPTEANAYLSIEGTGSTVTVRGIAVPDAPTTIGVRARSGTVVSNVVHFVVTEAVLERPPLTLPVTWGFGPANPIVDEAGSPWSMTAGGGRQSSEGDDNDAAMTANGRNAGTATFGTAPQTNMFLYPGNATGTGTTHGILWNTGGGFQGTPGVEGVTATRVRVAGFGDTEETAFLSIGGVPSSFRIIVDFAGTGGQPNPAHELVVLVDGEEVESFRTDQSSNTSGQNVVRGTHDFHGDTEERVTVHLGLRGGGSRRIFQVRLEAPPPYVPLVGINLPATTNVVLGTPEQLTVTFDPPNASEQRIEWVSSNDDYATVVNGLVTGLRAGVGETITITAISRAAGVADATTTVTLSYAPVAEVEISGEATIVVGAANLVLTAAVTPEAYVEHSTVTWLIGETQVTGTAPIVIGEVTVVSFTGNQLVLGSNATSDADITVTARSVSMGANGNPVYGTHEVEIVTSAPPVDSVEIVGGRFVGVGRDVGFDAIVLPPYAESTNVNWAVAPYSGDSDRTPGAATIQGASSDRDTVTIRGVTPGWVTITATSVADGDAGPVVRTLDVQVAAVQTDAALVHRTLTRAGTAENRAAFGAPPVVNADGTLRIEGAGSIDNTNLAGNFVWIDRSVTHESFRVEVDFCLERTHFGVNHANTKIGVFLSPDPNAVVQGNFHTSFTVVEGTIPPARGPQRARNHGNNDGFRNNSAIATPTADQWAAADVVTFGLQSTGTGGTQNHFFLFDGVPMGNSDSGATTLAVDGATSHVGIVVTSNGTSWTTAQRSEAAILEIRVWFDGPNGLATIIALDSEVEEWTPGPGNGNGGDPGNGNGGDPADSVEIAGGSSNLLAGNTSVPFNATVGPVGSSQSVTWTVGTSPDGTPGSIAAIATWNESTRTLAGVAPGRAYLTATASGTAVSDTVPFVVVQDPVWDGTRVDLAFSASSPFGIAAIAQGIPQGTSAANHQEFSVAIDTMAFRFGSGAHGTTTNTTLTGGNWAWQGATGAANMNGFLTSAGTRSGVVRIAALPYEVLVTVTYTGTGGTAPADVRFATVNGARGTAPGPEGDPAEQVGTNAELRTGIWTIPAGTAINIGSQLGLRIHSVRVERP